MPDSRKRLADGAFLVALMLYILSGMALVPPHGDEFMQVSMARDFFHRLHGDWAALAFVPPAEPDTLPYLRLINGTLNANLIGLFWWVSGRSEADLPGIFAWEMPLDWNQARGNVPADDALHLARWPSALLTALGVIPIFGIGWHLRLRSLAYPAALLYALHPTILLNGRRAMMEGSLMLFSLLTMYWLVALIVAEHSASAQGFMKRLPLWVRYGVLGLFIGLTLAAKHTGLVVAAAALLAALAAGIVRDKPRRPLRALGWTALAGVVGLAVWFALSPAYWRDPAGALRATLQARIELLQSQTESAALAHASLADRVAALITQPFMTPPQFYEAPTWSGVVDPQIAAYRASAGDGWEWGPIFGAGFTLLALIGLAALVRDAFRRDLIAWAILMWTAGSVLMALTIPINWQRYYLPLALVGIVLAAEGLGRLLVRRDMPAEEAPPRSRPLSMQGRDIR